MNRWIFAAAMWMSGPGFGAAAPAVELLELRLRAKLTYVDKTYDCDTGRLGVDMLLKGSVEGGRLKSLYLSNYPKEWAYQSIRREIALPMPGNYAVEKIDGRWWFRDLHKSEPLLKFVFNVILPREYWCKLPRTIHTAVPDNSTAHFELDGVEDGVEVSYSEFFKVSGIRDDKVPYEATFRLIQRSPSVVEAELFPELNTWGKK